MLVFATLAFAQNRETVKGCIAGNVTMEFKPNLSIGGEVKSYVWYKPRGFQEDPSFAIYESNNSPDLSTFFDEDNKVSGRIFHYQEEPATLYLTNLRKSDENKYTLVINFVEHVETPTEYIVDLVVEDVCFENPKEVGKCAVTTCYTGDNGLLKFPDGKENAINGYKLVKVCDKMTSGNFSCCNAAGTCLYQVLQESQGDTMPPEGFSNNTAITVVVAVVLVLAVVISVAVVYFKVVKRRQGNQVPTRESVDDEKVPL